MKERNALLSLSNIVSKIFKGLQKLNELVEDPKVIISTQSACDMSEIPDNSIDYIFTDPPYGKNVQYGELNFIWECFLRFDTSWLDDELTINEVRDKTEKDWEKGMKAAFSECFRVLKLGRWLSLCYHDSSQGTWGLVQTIMGEIGFIPDSLKHPLYIESKQKTFNKYNGSTPVKRDLIINFRKPYPEEELHSNNTCKFSLTFSQKVEDILIRSLSASPGQTMYCLYDEVVSQLVRRGEFEAHNFKEILEKVAEERVSKKKPYLGKWYLKR